ncbi:hypothetical protein BDV38DRAFT_292963 [Aspergillus pseudotamarii]|uniref:Dyp-type peroxidase n=1 Tax=Aspergillus pseudotamarii TaxID=132259 RepID=A0A5N6SUU1_ASPPS|nr:uncharacterized protein BDV38DRAFT_292963 [Aspergillus pseudotamarii]KAE8137510.1 hypothetical protein BDV38DRAFT_292963 [Aspergillus pseudotamarii]
MASQENLTTGVNKDNVQGNIWPGLPKEFELFYFFKISKTDSFRRHLRYLIPHITTANSALKARDQIAQHKAAVSNGRTHPATIPLAGVNIGFSANGLKKLVKNENDRLKAGPFLGGMLADLQGGTAGGEGRDNPEDWEKRFKENDIDGIILVTGDSEKTAYAKLYEVKSHFIGFFWFNSSIEDRFTIPGYKRPGQESNKEHFGYREHISQPQLVGLDPSPTGDKEPPPVPPGYIITNTDQDPSPQPDWATEGSFLVFRKLQQLVPEFNKWLNETAPKHDLTADQLSARLMGRWKSGAPLCHTLWEDNPALAENNDFDFKPTNTQEHCPFAAHIRKARPRGDLADKFSSAIIRRGIPYGPEVTKTEQDQQTTKEDRGMLFVCYQSNISNGFRRIQEQWCNKNTFPSGKKRITGDPGPGADPICGQPNGPDPFVMGLCDGKNNNIHVDLHCCVIPRGGEYFFSPSIAALRKISNGST